jgi:hypothetical protein
MAVETFDRKGDPIKGTKTIEIISHAGENSGVRFEGKDLLAVERAAQGAGMVRTRADRRQPRGRVRQGQPEEQVRGRPDVVNDDPSAENRDPKAAKKK